MFILIFGTTTIAGARVLARTVGSQIQAKKNLFLSFARFVMRAAGRGKRKFKISSLTKWLRAVAVAAQDVRVLVKIS